MLIKIKADTSELYREGNIEFNTEMYYALIPYIKYLITDINQVISINEIDIIETSKDYDNGNGHCIRFANESGYMAAYEIDEMIIDTKDINTDIFYLSDLCDYISKTQKVKNWIK